MSDSSFPDYCYQTKFVEAMEKHLERGAIYIQDLEGQFDAEVEYILNNVEYGISNTTETPPGRSWVINCIGLAFLYRSINKPLKDEKTFDPVNRPSHYNSSDLQPIDAIEKWGLGFCLGNSVKYIARSGKKENHLEDLKKAQWYLEREINNMENSHVDITA